MKKIDYEEKANDIAKLYYKDDACERAELKERILNLVDEAVKNTVGLGDVSVSLDEAMSLIDDYLNAGFKENRTKAHDKGKELYEKYYGKKYINRNER